MPKQRINPTTLSKPTGYSHVVKVGNIVYLAGQVALKPDGTIAGPGDPRAQTEQVYRNIQAALTSVGATLKDLVKTTTFVTSPDYISAIREVRVRYLPDEPPASTLVVVSRLAQPEFLVEIEGIAHLD